MYNLEFKKCGKQPPVSSFPQLSVWVYEKDYVYDTCCVVGTVCEAVDPWRSLSWWDPEASFAPAGPGPDLARCQGDISH